MFDIEQKMNSAFDDSVKQFCPDNDVYLQSMWILSDLHNDFEKHNELLAM